MLESGDMILGRSALDVRGRFNIEAELERNLACFDCSIIWQLFVAALGGEVRLEVK
jgi:hypothetical protein